MFQKKSTTIPKPTVCKLVHSPWRDEVVPSEFLLAPCDQTSSSIATCRATFFSKELDPICLEQALELVLEDLPYLGGRIVPINFLSGWKLGDLRISCNNQGAMFTVLEARNLSYRDAAPDTWPMQNVTISKPRVPFYLPSIDVSPRALFAGKESLFKCQLTLLSDGCILGISLSHVLTDGMHWPMLMRHIAARYRQIATGHEASTDELVPLVDRKAGLSLKTLRGNLDNVPADWAPEPFIIKPSFGDYFRAMSLLVGNASTEMQQEIIYLPRTYLAKMKQHILENSTEKRVTTGDIVQALAAILIHAAEGKSLLPLLPKCMLVLVQIPGTSSGYFGNAVHPMPVGVDLEKFTDVPSDSDAMDCLRMLATCIRTNTLELRSNPTKALQAIYESECVCHSKTFSSLAFLAGKRLPYVTCTTNYIGSMSSDKQLDFGNGSGPIGYRNLTLPLARSMAVIRPALLPYEEGLFMQLSVTPKQAKVLKSHPALAKLVPNAVFLGHQADIPIKN